MFLGKQNIVSFATEEYSETEIDRQIKAQESAMNAHETLYSNFRLDENDEYIYPMEFAGSYIDKDKLVILLSEHDENDEKYYKELLEEYDCVEIETVEYSYNELREMSEKAVDSIKEEYTVLSYGVGMRDNNIKIGIETTVLPRNTESIFEKTEGVDLGRIQIVLEEPMKMEALVAGDSITSPASVTLGMCGEYNGYSSIVTCGHGITLNSTVKKGTITLGTVAYRRYTIESNNYNCTGDFSIIKVPSQTLSNRVKTGSTSSTTITGTYSSPPEGALLYKYGKTTKQSLVEVTGVNITWTIDGKKTKGLTKAIISSGDSDGGDSGGPYRHNNKFCGVHKGSQVSGTKKYVYFTPYSYIKNAGFTAKTN